MRFWLPECSPVTSDHVRSSVWTARWRGEGGGARMAKHNPIQSNPHRIGLDLPWAPSASGEANGKTSVYWNTFCPFSVTKYCFLSSDRKPRSTSSFRYLSVCRREDSMAAATSEFTRRSRSWMTLRTRTILFLKAGVGRRSCAVFPQFLPLPLPPPHCRPPPPSVEHNSN